MNDNATNEPVATPSGQWIGARVPRREDSRLLTGSGHFVDDIERPNLLHAAFTRSPLAAASIAAIDPESARPARGVAEVFTGADLAVGGLSALLERDEFTPTSMPILAEDRVRYAGEPVALALAEDPYVAEDAAELVGVDYEERTAVTSVTDALDADAASVHEELTANTFLDVTPFDDDEIDDQFSRADHVVDLATDTARQCALPLETRGCLAEWVPRDEQLVIHISTQVPHQVRTAVARCTGLAERAVRVLVPDVGGGFGLKCVVGREEIAVAAAALRLRRPVKWVEDRREALTASFHGREQSYRARAAFDSEGQLLGLDADVACDVGAYSAFPFTCGVEPLMAASEFPGVYRVPRYRVRARAIATNKTPTAPYRGVSRPQIVLVMERLMALAARELGIDSVELRRKNLIDEFPYLGVNGVTYDPGTYRESLDLCEQRLRAEGWEQERADSNRVIGIGYACFNERTAYGTDAFAQRTMSVVPGYDISEVRMDPSGTVTVSSGTSSHGQGHETTLAQVAAEALGMRPQDVTIRQGDTDRVSYGWGTFGSRSAAIGGGAVRVAATRLAETLCSVAAGVLDIAESDVALADAQAYSQSDPSVVVTYADLAELSYLRAHRLPKGVHPGLSAEAVFDVPGSGTFSNATHGVVTELDPDTGQVRILRYLVVEDCGVVINPTIVDGQVRGGVAQGVAGALYESIGYDADGQPTNANLIDYMVPTATEVPDVTIEHLETPCAFTETGAKGMGEGGTIGAPGAVLDAVNDALHAVGAPAESELNTVPITPQQITTALEACR